MIQLSVALVTGEGMKNITFEKDKYIYLPYYTVTEENVGDVIRREK